MSGTDRKPRVVRRREIAEAALRIIGTEGVRGVSTAALALQVGLTSGALFRHFATVDEVYDEVVAYAAERLDTTYPDPGLPPLERLVGLAKARIALLGKEPGIHWLLRSPDATHSLTPAASAALASIVGRSRQVLGDAIRQGQRDGTIRTDVPDDVMLVMVTATVHALVGTPGIHGRVERPARPDSERALEGLLTLLRPSARPARVKRPGKKVN